MALKLSWLLKDTDNVNIRGFDHYFKTCMPEVDVEPQVAALFL